MLGLPGRTRLLLRECQFAMEKFVSVVSASQITLLSRRARRGRSKQSSPSGFNVHRHARHRVHHHAHARDLWSKQVYNLELTPGQGVFSHSVSYFKLDWKRQHPHADRAISPTRREFPKHAFVRISGMCSACFPALWTNAMRRELISPYTRAPDPEPIRTPDQGRIG